MSSEETERLDAKSQHGQFQWELENEFELAPRIAKAVVETARQIYELDRLNSATEKNGTVKKLVIRRQAQHGPPMEKLEKTRVSLTLDKGQEDQKVFREQGSSALRQKKILRMVEEANQQGGTLSQEDLADLLEVSVRTIQRDINKLEDDGLTVATRGIIEDIGPATSHKVKIVEMYLKGYTYSEIATRSRHRPFSIQRYITHFSQVVLLTDRGLEVEEIRFGVGISRRLVEQYQQLYEKYDTPEYEQRLEDLITIRRPDREDQKKGDVA